jgi:hypothetical protein
LRDRIGRKLADRTQQEVVALEKAAHPVKELGAQVFGPGDLLRCEGETLLDVPEHRVLEQVAVLAIERAVILQEGERRQGLERFRRAREIRLRFFDDAPERRKDLSLSLRGRRSPGDPSAAAEIAAPGTRTFRKSLAASRGKRVRAR